MNMKKIIEIVPNYSEGKNKDVMEKIIAPFKNKEGIMLTTLEMDGSYNRSVVTVIGEADAVLSSMIESGQIATSLIDLNYHKGEHKRMGAVDVCPIIPIQNISVEECLEIVAKFAKEYNEATNVPVYLYNKSAKKENRVSLPDIRKGEFEGMKEKIKLDEWYPDFGKNEIHLSAGVVAIGVREFLIAYNIDLDTDNKDVASKIAKRIRYSGGGYRYIQAGPAYIETTNHVQVTMNITDYHKNSLYQAFEAVSMEARRYGVKIKSSEIVGLVPLLALKDAVKYYLMKNEDEELSLSLEKITEYSKKFLLLKEFDERKIIEYYVK